MEQDHKEWVGVPGEALVIALPVPDRRCRSTRERITALAGEDIPGAADEDGPGAADVVMARERIQQRARTIRPLPVQLIRRHRTLNVVSWSSKPGDFRMS